MRLPLNLIIFLLITICNGSLVNAHIPTGTRSSPPLNNLNLIVGFRGGVNFSQPLVIRRNDVLQGQLSAEPVEKEYNSMFSNLGYQYAFLVMVYLKEATSLSFEPGFTSYRYGYHTLTGWTNGSDAADYIEYEARHNNRVNYLELPFVLRHEFSGKKIIPFVSFGFFYGFMIGAEKQMESTVTRYSGTVAIPYENTSSISNNSSSYIRSRIGISPGVGIFYPLGPVKLMFSADVGLGFNNIINESQRYGNAPVSAGMYDVQDDLKLGTLNIHIGILFNTGSNQAGKQVECISFKKRK